MSLWMEIRCGGQTTPGCHQGVLPDGLNKATSHGARLGFKHLRKKAENLGWRREEHTMWCPNCIKARKPDAKG